MTSTTLSGDHIENDSAWKVAFKQQTYNTCNRSKLKQEVGWMDKIMSTWSMSLLNIIISENLQDEADVGFSVLVLILELVLLQKKKKYHLYIR